MPRHPPACRKFLVAILAGLAALPALAVAEAGAVTIETAEQATLLLVRAHALDTRCRFLDASEQRDLAFLAARAEIATASQVSTEAAMAAVAAGRSAAQGLSCDAAAGHDIRQLVAAARSTVGQASPAPPPPEAEITPEGAEVLHVYGRLVTAFYLENKCRHLSDAQDKRYWRSISRLHRRAVAANGASAVAPMMRRSEALARSIPCGSESLLAVKEAFAQTLRQ